MTAILLVICLSLTWTAVHCLDNGLALTPPMGWNPWERFRCNTDCVNDPDNCISERLFMQMADIVSFGGYKDAGYNFINLDDCWMAKERDAQGRLYGDPERFPHGIKALADYVHAKGLKFGVYQDMGTVTCDGFPGTVGHIDIDAQTYAEWGVDLLKMDGCHNEGPVLFPQGFKNMSAALIKTGRKIVFSCEWGLYQPKPNYTDIGVYCNSMRNYKDEQDSWSEMLSVLDWYTSKQDVLSKVNGPGKFIDMDFLVVGDFSLSYDQAKSQMALWSIMSSQLLMSNDLRNIDPRMRDILLNTEVLAVNQDRLGKMGINIYKKSYFQVWTKGLDLDCFAAVVFSRATDMPHNFTLSLEKLGVPSGSFIIRDLYQHKVLGVYQSNDQFDVIVNPGGVVMIKGIPVEKFGKFDRY